MISWLHDCCASCMAEQSITVWENEIFILMLITQIIKLSPKGGDFFLAIFWSVISCCLLISYLSALHFSKHYRLSTSQQSCKNEHCQSFTYLFYILRTARFFGQQEMLKYCICDAIVGSWNVMLMLLMSDPFKYSHSMPIWTRHSFQYSTLFGRQCLRCRF